MHARCLIVNCNECPVNCSSNQDYWHNCPRVHITSKICPKCFENGHVVRLWQDPGSDNVFPTGHKIFKHTPKSHYLCPKCGWDGSQKDFGKEWDQLISKFNIELKKSA